MSNDLIDFNMPYGMTEKRRTTRTPLMTFNVALSTTTQDLYGLNDWKIGQTEDDQKRNVDIALSNTFGFGGHNACVVFSKLD